MEIGSTILELLEVVFAFWNNQVGIVFALLMESPTSFKSGGPWAIVEGIEPIFVAVGSSLVVLFFVIGFCSESVDIREEMRFEVILRMLIRLGLSEWLVVNNVTIMKAIFKTIGNLVGVITEDSFPTVEISDEMKDTIRNINLVQGIIMLIITCIVALVVIVCGFMLIYSVYMRFLRLLVIVPFGSVAYATLGGNRSVSQTAATYSKYFLSASLEAVAMALAIVVCDAFINAGLPTFTSSYAVWAQTIIYLSELTFSIALTVGAVRGAQQLMSRVMGL